MKILEKTEFMFSQALALSQRGLLRSTIYGKDRTIFILNMDNTVLIRFTSDQKFDKPFGFYANNYESRHMEVSADEQVTFISENAHYKKERLSEKVQNKFADVESIWNGYQFDTSKALKINKNILPLLDEGLSHVEFSFTKSELKVIQKDIYSGSRVTITEKANDIALFKVTSETELNGIFAVRTNDLIGLFTFVDELDFYFNPNLIHFKADNWMDGIMSLCLYDELGTIGG